MLEKAQFSYLFTFGHFNNNALFCIKKYCYLAFNIQFLVNLDWVITHSVTWKGK